MSSLSTCLLLIVVGSMVFVECFAFVPSAFSNQVGLLRKQSTVALLLRKGTQKGVPQGRNICKCYGVRRSKTCASANSQPSISVSPASAANKWEVLEKFQSTADLNDFVVSNAIQKQVSLRTTCFLYVRSYFTRFSRNFWCPRHVCFGVRRRNKTQTKKSRNRGPTLKTIGESEMTL